MEQGRWRYLAQNVLTGQWLHRNLPLQRTELTWQLNNPGSLRGNIQWGAARDLIQSGEPILQEWQTAIYAEADGEIRWGGLLNNAPMDGPTWSLECSGFSGYAGGMIYTGPYYKKTAYDPILIFRDIWNHLQTQPDGNLGMTLSYPASTVRVGTAEEPYELAPWEQTELSAELSQIATETPFDFYETHAWNGEAVSHKLIVGYPRTGRRRDDLRFVQGSNVTKTVPLDRDGDNYANYILGLGKGEGAARLRSDIAVRDGRLRRTAAMSDPLAGTTARVNALARKEQTFRQLLPTISSISVKDHKNARIGSWQLGDDILVQAPLPWRGWTSIWHRIIGWTLVSDTRAEIQLARSDSFRYGG